MNNNKRFISDASARNPSIDSLTHLLLLPITGSATSSSHASGVCLMEEVLIDSCLQM
jgi:hypothetical protein